METHKVIIPAYLLIIQTFKAERDAAVASTRACSSLPAKGQDLLKHIMTLMSGKDNHIVLVFV